MTGVARRTAPYRRRASSLAWLRFLTLIYFYLQHRLCHMFNAPLFRLRQLPFSSFLSSTHHLFSSLHILLIYLLASLTHHQPAFEFLHHVAVPIRSDVEQYLTWYNRNQPSSQNLCNRTTALRQRQELAPLLSSTQPS